VARAVELMPADMPVLVMPMMPVGKSNEHHAYPGTLSLSYETLAGSGTSSARAPIGPG
jgi:creatinine amidohydrolase